ncbi:MAG TPA: hypothetical protein VIP56_09200 [Nitrososphaeraceae archaeon]
MPRVLLRTIEFRKISTILTFSTLYANDIRSKSSIPFGKTTTPFGLLSYD